MATYDSVCFDLRMTSVTIMNVLIMLIVTRHLVQLTLVSHIRKYDLCSKSLHFCYDKMRVPMPTCLCSERLAVLLRLQASGFVLSS